MNIRLVSLLVFIAIGSFAFAAEPTKPEPAPEITIAIVVAGEVHKPGKYQLPTGSTVWIAIEEAGGFAIQGSGTRPVRVMRRMKDGSTVHYIFEEKKKTEYGDAAILQDGDRVLVPTVR